MRTPKSPKRRNFRKEEKCAILSEYFEHKCSMIEVANRHGIHPVTLAQWKRQMSDKNPKMNHDQAELIAEAKKHKDEIKRLKKIIADLSEDKEILSEAIEIYQEFEKKDKSK